MSQRDENTPRRVVPARPAFEIEKSSSKPLRAHPDTKAPALDNVQPIKIVSRGPYKVAEGFCENTASFQLEQYRKMLPEVHQAECIIRAKDGNIAVTELERIFQGTTLGEWAGRDEWNTMLEAFTNPKEKVATAKSIGAKIAAGKVATAAGMTRAIIRRKMGGTDATVKSNLSRARKRLRIRHSTGINRDQPS